MKIVINDTVGGFCLSKEAYDFLGLEWDGYGCVYNNKRTDPKLIECVEKLGVNASGYCAYLVIIEIPDKVEYTIENDEGIERIIEKHRIWCADE